MFHSKLVGVSFENDEGVPIQKILKDLSKEGYEGEEIMLDRETDLEGHPNSIRAYTTDGRNIGHIKSEVSKELAPLIDSGVPVRAFCTEITGGGDKFYGCNIKVYVGDETEEPEEEKTEKMVNFIVSAMVVGAFLVAYLFFEWLI